MHVSAYPHTGLLLLRAGSRAPHLLTAQYAGRAARPQLASHPRVMRLRHPRHFLHTGARHGLRQVRGRGGLLRLEKTHERVDPAVGEPLLRRRNVAIEVRGMRPRN
jgi:hypothetical protein